MSSNTLLIFLIFAVLLFMTFNRKSWDIGSTDPTRESFPLSMKVTGLIMYDQPRNKDNNTRHPKLCSTKTSHTHNNLTSLIRMECRRPRLSRTRCHRRPSHTRSTLDPSYIRRMGCLSRRNTQRPRHMCRKTRKATRVYCSRTRLRNTQRPRHMYCSRTRRMGCLSRRNTLRPRRICSMMRLSRSGGATGARRARRRLWSNMLRRSEFAEWWYVVLILGGGSWDIPVVVYTMFV